MFRRISAATMVALSRLWLRLKTAGLLQVKNWDQKRHTIGIINYWLLTSNQWNIFSPGLFTFIIPYDVPMQHSSRATSVCFLRSPQGFFPSGVPSHDFYHNFCSACAVSDSYHFRTLKSFFTYLLTCPSDTRWREAVENRRFLKGNPIWQIEPASEPLYMYSYLTRQKYNVVRRRSFWEPVINALTALLNG